mmetsp:Transcript_70333/g.184364  ORF Transcript_70333/g.184364 Transcript_70333/m.184364 type:complete len:245 (+) Transcript_70333:1233-1967(+)
MVRRGQRDARLPALPRPGSRHQEFSAPADPALQGGDRGAVPKRQTYGHDPGGVPGPGRRAAEGGGRRLRARAGGGRGRLLLPHRRDRGQGDDRGRGRGRDRRRRRRDRHRADAAEARGPDRGHGPRARAALPGAEERGVVVLPRGGGGVQAHRALRALHGRGPLHRGEAAVPGHQARRPEPDAARAVRLLRRYRQEGGAELPGPGREREEARAPVARGGRGPGSAAYPVPAVGGRRGQGGRQRG